MEDFSKEMEYGNYLDFDRFPLDCESVAMMQSTLRHYAAIAQIAGYDFLILSGCQESGGYRGEGYVFVKENGSMTGEVLFHPKAAPQSTCSVSEVKYDVSADGETFFNAYSKRRLIEGGSQFYWSNAGRLSEVSNKALKARIENEENERKNTVNNLTATVTNEYKAAIKAAIDNEAAARQNADSALNSAISNEATARANADSTEKAAREAADKALSDRIDVLTGGTDASELVAVEEKARIAKDNELISSISSEIAARKSADDALLAKINEIKAALLPSGTIVIWSGHYTTIPTGWVLCDGHNGAPDLRKRFVMGASAEVLINGSWQAGGYNGETAADRWICTQKDGGTDKIEFQIETDNLPIHKHEIHQVDFNIPAPLNKNGCPNGSKDSGDGTNADNGRGAYWRGIASQTIKIGDKYNRKYTQDTGKGEKITINHLPPYYTLCYIMKL